MYARFNQIRIISKSYLLYKKMLHSNVYPKLRVRGNSSFGQWWHKGGWGHSPSLIPLKALPLRHNPKSAAKISHFSINLCSPHIPFPSMPTPMPTPSHIFFSDAYYWLLVKENNLFNMPALFKGAQSYLFNFFFQTFGDFVITRKLIFFL